MTPKRIIVIGEGMVELSGDAAKGWRLGYGGDTLNTAVYLARLLGVRAWISFMTRLGGDPYGTRMLQSWSDEAIGLDLTEVVADRTTGFYAISTDAKGERSFTYWRDKSPARELLSQTLGEDQRLIITSADLLFFSGITLAILTDAGRSQLIDLAETAKASGNIVAFDPNYRSRLWTSKVDATHWITKALRTATIAFAAADEIETLFAITDRAGQIRLLADLVPEAILREGAGPVSIRTNGTTKRVNLPPVRHPKDTTGAGDSFNAAYLAARLNDLDPAKAAKLACKLAAEVIRHNGAIIPQAAMPLLNIFAKD